MTKEEREVQRALGHLRTYCGYVKEDSSNAGYFDVYEVEDVSMDGAREQLDEMLIRTVAEFGVSLTLDFIVEEDNPQHVRSGGRKRYARRRRHPKA